jgi:DNA-binding Lrp family transcriptional regulator
VDREAMSAKRSAASIAVDGITVFVEVRLNGQGEESRRHFENAIAAHPEVLECFAMTGDADYLLRVTARDVRAYHHFLDGSLRRIKWVRMTKSSVAIRQVKTTPGHSPA